MAVANQYYNNTLGTKYDVNAPNYLQQVVAVMKTQKYLPPTQRDQFIQKMKNDVVFTRSILPQLAQLENDVLYTKNGIQVKNTYDNLGFSQAETNALDYLQTIRTFGNQQITDEDILLYQSNKVCHRSPLMPNWKSL